VTFAVGEAALVPEVGPLVIIRNLASVRRGVSSSASRNVCDIAPAKCPQERVSLTSLMQNAGQPAVIGG